MCISFLGCDPRFKGLSEQTKCRGGRNTKRAPKTPRGAPNSSKHQVKKLESAKVTMNTSSKAGTHNFWKMSSSTSDSTWTVAARGAMAAKVTKMASKFSGVHPEFQRSLVTQIQLPMRVLIRIDPDFAGPTATAIPMALPLGKGHYGKYLMKSVQKVWLL